MSNQLKVIDLLIPQLKLTIIILALLLTVSITAKAIGSLQPINPAMRGFIEGCEDKPQPCWYGVVPGETSLEDAKVMWNLDIPHPTSSVVTVELPETGYICNIVVTQPQITLFFLYFCENIDVSIGEFFATVGFPSGIYDAPYQLYYDSNDRLLPSGWSLFDRVVIANFYSENVTHNEWHGFVPLWRYCQLEPELELPDCTK